MPRQTYAPLADLASLMPADAREVSPELEADLHAAFYESLLGYGFTCNGKALGRERDPAWHHDIAGIVLASKRHTTYTYSGAGLYVPQDEAVILPTLLCEVDDNGEICCWVYSSEIFLGNS